MEDIKCAKCGKEKSIYNAKEFCPTSFGSDELKKSVDLCFDCLVEITGKESDRNTAESIISDNKIIEWAKQKELDEQEKS